MLLFDSHQVRPRDVLFSVFRRKAAALAPKPYAIARQTGADAACLAAAEAKRQRRADRNRAAGRPRDQKG